jgi:hypothetical protein
MEAHMFSWIYDFPSWFGSLFFAFLFVAFNTLGVHYVRPKIRAVVADIENANDLVANAMAIYSVMFGILLGMLAVITYQNLTDAQSVADSEATAIGALYRDVSSYPEPTGTALRTSMKEYTRYVIDDAWPLQQRGIVPKGGVERVSAIQDVLFAFEPKTEGQKLVHGETLRQFNEFVVFRRARLNSTTTSIPSILWQIMVGGSVICLVMIWLFEAHTRAMLLMSGISAFALGAVIGLIALMDNPFMGELSVSSQSYELIYQQLMAGT